MSIVVIKGNDPVLLGDEVRSRVDALVGDADRSLVVEELTEETYRLDDQFEISRLVDAAQTPPFLTDFRVVVARHCGRFSKAADVAPLVRYLADPLASSRLVLVWEVGVSPKQDRMPAIPKSLREAVEGAGGEVVDVVIPMKGASKWLDAKLASSEVRLDRAAVSLIGERLGEDRSRVLGLIGTLEATFGPGTALSADDVEPYLGEKGSVPPWDLTDAIDAGDTPKALEMLSRMTGAGDRHAMQIMATLNTHYGRMLRLDGANAANDKAAATMLGMKGSTYPAKKALTQTRRLGSEKVHQAIRLLAQADLDLRGGKAWPNELVLEVLIARLARLGRR